MNKWQMNEQIINEWNAMQTEVWGTRFNSGLVSNSDRILLFIYL